MSTLQFLRERAGVLVAGVIGLSLFIFVISDFFGGGRGQRLAQSKYYEIGKVAGERISYQDYQKRIENLQEIYKLSGTSTIDEATSENIREQMWQQIIREMILESKYEDLGIGVSSEELEELVMGNNPHPIVRQLFTDRQTNQFNQSFLVNFLKSTETDETSKTYWLFFEDQIVADRMSTKFNTLVSKGLYVTSKQAEFDRKTSERTVDFSYVMKSYATVPDSSITISESEIEKYYSEHKEAYRRTSQRDIEYLTFDIIPSEDDFKQSEDWIIKTKSEFESAENPEQFINSVSDTRHTGFFSPISDIPDTLKDFVKKENRNAVFGPYLDNGSYKLARLISFADRPDSVHARHILISPNQSMTLQQAQAKADSLADLIKKGMPFGIIAQANSDDQGSAQAGGDLGWFREGMMVVPFNNACFSSNKGDIKVVESNFGIHVIEVMDISKKVRKYDLGIIDRKVVPGSLTIQKFYGEASQFAGNNDTYEKFSKTIAEQGLNKKVAGSITPQQKTLPGLDNPRYLIMSLFQSEKDKIILDQNQQAVFEVGNKYVVAYCTGIVEEGIAPLKDVRADVSYSLTRDKKAEKLAADLAAVAEKEKTLEGVSNTIGSPIQEAAQVNFRSYSIAGAGIEPSLIAAASAAEQGKLAGPVKGNNGVFFFTVNNVVSAGDEDLKLLRERLAATYGMRGSYEAYEALRKDANIIDRRYKFY
jgi:peptidyl-prolyl cis-trans isomerase D